VTRDTAVIRKIALAEKNSDWASASPYMPFFDFYKNLFGLGPDVILPRGPVAYKEFSRKHTYLIQCIPDAFVPRVCPGI
jgi:hypothetical protein